MTFGEFPELRCSGLLASLGNGLTPDRLRGDSSKYRQDQGSWESQGGELENSVLTARLSSLLTFSYHDLGSSKNFLRALLGLFYLVKF